MKIIHHNITEHQTNYSVETVIKIACHDKRFKNEVLKMCGYKEKQA